MDAAKQAAKRAAVAAGKWAVRAVSGGVGAVLTNRKLVIAAAVGLLVTLIVLITLMAAGPGGAAIALGDKILGFAGLKKEHIAWIDELDEDLRKKLEGQYGELYAKTLDCSNFPPAERKPGENCIEGLLAAFQKQKSAIPESAYWLVPVYKQAAKRYKLDWKLLAAINGARTRFGDRNCSYEEGIGFYRLHKSAWERYRVNAGSTETSSAGPDCRRSEPPANVYRRFQKQWKPGNKERYAAPKSADPYEAVDAVFTQARLLARQGAYGKMEGGWKYSGSPSRNCTPPDGDGRVYFAPEFDISTGTGVMGYNRKLHIPRKIVAIAAKWRSNKGRLKPRRDRTPPADKPMPPKLLLRMLVVAWKAFGASERVAQRNAELNLAQIMRESGGRPYVLQGYIGDVNDHNPAGGLFQFTKGTFEHWKVDGYNDRFNPIDNILAAVNAQVNGPYRILDGTSGWSPPFSHNPYATGGRKANSKLVSGKQAKRIGKRDYTGRKQTDPVSKAVAFDGERTMSACYVAVVWDWYKAIEKYPPKPGAEVSGAVRSRIVQLARAELKRNVAERCGNNCPATPDGKPRPYNINDAWCAAFATWIWKQAGLSSYVNSMTNRYYVPYIQNWAQSKGLWKTSNPQPGDFIVYGGSGHIGIVEKVRRGKIVSSIEGNYSNRVARRVAPTAQIGYVSVPGGVRGGEGRYPGPWMGSKAIVRELARGTGHSIAGGKRSPAKNRAVGGSSTSMHLTTNKRAYAKDFPYDQKILTVISKNLGHKRIMRLGQTWEGGYKGYEIEVIATNHGTGPHIHLGARWP